MKAILLGYDQHVGFMELTYKAYQALWPECPLSFRIPINRQDNPDFEVFRGKGNVELVESRAPFKATTRALLEGLNAEDWVYWCISDRYPTRLDSVQLNRVYSWIEAGHGEAYNALRLVVDREQVSDEIVDVTGLYFSPKMGIHYGFWHHQFCKVKVLVANLLHPNLQEDYRVHQLNQRFQTIADRPDGSISVFENTLVSRKSLLTLAEPCLQGQLTANGLADLKRYACRIPDLPTTSKEEYFS